MVSKSGVVRRGPVVLLLALLTGLAAVVVPGAASPAAAAAPEAPTIFTPANGSTTNNRLPEVYGAARARNATVTVYLDGSSIGTTSSNDSALFSLRVPTALADGTHTVYATTTVDGQTGAASPSNTFTVDTIAPAAPVVNAPPNGGITSTRTPTFTGTAEADATVRVFANGLQVGITTADGSRQWSLTPSEALPLGASELTATATDAAGNVSPSSPRVSVIVDTTAPAAPVITSPANGSVISGRDTEYAGTAEASSRVAVSLDGRLVDTVRASAAGAWSLSSTTDLDAGEHTLTATATDTAGNTSAPASTTFTVDATAPVPTITTIGAGPFGRTIPFRVTFDEPVEFLSAYRVYVVRDGAFVTDSRADVVERGAGFDVTVTFPERVGGSGVVRLVLDHGAARDLAGNDSAFTNGPDAAYDLIAPAAPVVTTPADGASVNTPSPVYAGTAEPGSRVSILLSGGQVATATTDQLGRWSTTDTNSFEGVYTFVVTARAVDAAGNESPESDGNAFTLDTVAPTLVLTAPSGLQRGEFTVEATFSEAVTGFELADVQVTDGRASGLTALSPTRYTFVVTPLRAGEVAVAVAGGAATDTAGNASTADRLVRSYEPPASPAVSLGTPVVTGEPVVGAELRVATTVTPSTAQLTYQWSRVVGATTTEIAGATGAAYRVTPADAGARLLVTVIGRAPGHLPDLERSQPTAPVGAAETGDLAVSIGGTARVGERLTATVPTPQPDVVRTYQWQASSPGEAFRDLPGATRSTLDVAPGLAGSVLRVVVTDVRPGYADAVGVATTRPVSLAALALTRPRIIGSRPVRPGDVVRAAVRASSEAGGAVAGLRLTYTWLVDGEALRAGGESITVPRRATGSMLRLRVVASAPGHTGVTAWSARIRVRAPR